MMSRGTERVGRGSQWVLAQAVLLSAVIGSGFFADRHWDSAAGRVGGVALLALAGLSMASGALSLGRNLTPFPRPGREARLVQTGVYAWVRHPLYAALMVGAVGWALFRENLWTLGAAAALVLFLHAKARREEAWLKEHFPDYAAYARRVPRFLPFLY